VLLQAVSTTSRLFSAIQPRGLPFNA